MSGRENHEENFLTFWLFAMGLSAFSNDSLLIRGDDLRLVYVADDAEDSSKSASSGASLNDDFDEISGFHLYIRKKEGIESVLLCDTTEKTTIIRTGHLSTTR